MPVADAAVQQLCRHTAGWLLGPLARETSAASVAVTSAVSTFMWWLVVDDDGYRCGHGAFIIAALVSRQQHSCIMGSCCRSVQRECARAAGTANTRY